MNLYRKRPDRVAVGRADRRDRRIHDVVPGGGRFAGPRFGCSVDGGALRHGYSKVPGTEVTFYCRRCMALDPSRRLTDLIEQADKYVKGV